jgi:predicted ATP-grasp superfamily ATP-dependent carboligase
MRQPDDASGPEHDRIVILGASGRAAAVSAAAAGLEVHAADLFGDLDLLAVATSFQSACPYPAGLATAAAACPPAPWLYTGGIENHPDLIAAIAAHRPLAGCDAAAVRRVRDPDLLVAALRGIGLAMPATRRSPRGLPGDGSWLVKPLRSAGGHGIRPWVGQDLAAATAERVWQQRVAGTSWSVAYLLAGDGGRLLGASRQLTGRRWCRAGPFAYCGSLELFTTSLEADPLDSLRRLGDLLAGPLGLRGLVGVDLVIDARGRPHVIEVNPRPTASMELIERASGLPLIAAHLAACGLGPPARARPRGPRGNWSKAILFADRPLAIGAEAVAALRTAAGGPRHGWPLLADIPTPPQQIPAGRPVCTLFAHGGSPRESLQQLRRSVLTAARALGPVAQPASRRSAGSDSAMYCIR